MHVFNLPIEGGLLSSFFFLRNYNINKLESFVQFIRKLMFSLLVSKADAHFQSYIMQVLTVCSMYVKESAALEFGFNA